MSLSPSSLRSSIARCTSSFSNTAQCKLDRDPRPLVLTSVIAFPEYVAGAGGIEPSATLVELDKGSVVGLDVRCEGTMTGVGRGGGGH
jgi:hypothetical protein